MLSFQGFFILHAAPILPLKMIIFTFLNSSPFYMSDNTPKRLFLLDAYALIYRAYFAFSNNQRFNSKGLNTSAILGFTNTLMEVLRKEKPSHIAVVFDTAEPTVRHTDFTEYKANREEMPEDLAASIPYIIRLLEGFNIPVLFSDGYEADDVIGTLACRAKDQGFITYMMTPDKDFGQLVNDTTFIYRPSKPGAPAEKWGIAEVCKRFEIERPEQVIDILGLMGDKVDNIPGIPGVGEKTAIQLVKDFGSVENLLANTDKLKGKLKERVEENRDKAIMSKKLATILCDAPVEFNEEKLMLSEPNREALKDLFIELEFRRLAEQVLGSSVYTEKKEETVTMTFHPGTQGDLFDQSFSSHTTQEVVETAPPKVFLTSQTVPHTYHLVDTAEKRAKLIYDLTSQDAFCFDTETTSLDAHSAELVGFSFSWKPLEAWYVPVPHDRAEAQVIVDQFKPVFQDERIDKIAQNMKYDMNVLSWYGVEIKGKMFDTMVAHFLIQPEMRHNMNILAETYLNYSPISIETLIGKKGKGQLSMRAVPVDLVAEYAAEDADVTIQLKDKFVPMLRETSTTKLFEEIEMPLVPVLAAMEAEGIRVDKQILKEYSAALETHINELDKQIQDDAGIPFNVGSPKQVGDILFDVLKIVEKPKKTKTGQYATGEDVLGKLIGKHPIVERILEYRELCKLKSTYVDSLPTLINPKTGRIHTCYNQVVAVTGRLSSDNPNLQNIPIRTERGREVRKAFVARDENHVLLSADYSQIELRIIAELSKDPGMIEAFQSGQDIHTATAAKVYGVEPDAVTREMRSSAKMVNFGIIYGISSFGLAERLNIPKKEAANIIQQYFIKYPLIKEYMDNSIEIARERGYVETIMGRRRYLRDINSGNAVVRGFAERNAINAPIQGSAADMIKIAMIEIHKEFKARNFRSKMLLQVHDELVFDAHKDEVDIIRPIIEDKMKHAIRMSVPIEVGMGTGNNWLEAH
jgi:DNA polymerase-1